MKLQNDQLTKLNKLGSEHLKQGAKVWMESMEDQAKAAEKWADNLAKLHEKGLTAPIIDALAKPTHDA